MMLNEAADAVKHSPDLQAKMSDDPVGTLATMASASMPLQSDGFIYRAVVLGLIFAVLLSMLGVFALSFMGKAVPGEVTALGSTALGGLVGLLAPSPKR